MSAQLNLLYFLVPDKDMMISITMLINNVLYLMKQSTTHFSACGTISLNVCTYILTVIYSVPSHMVYLVPLVTTYMYLYNVLTVHSNVGT